jgi:hypothetical protein
VPRPLDPIDQLLALDLGRRGIASFFTPGAAAAAAAALLQRSATGSPGRSERRRVWGAMSGPPTILIATGFTVAADTPETDGPPGAAALGRALRALGASVHYVTDAHNVAIVEAALKTHGEPADVIAYPFGDGHARALLARLKPTHLVAIERPGRTARGTCCNLRGVEIDEWNCRVDELFLSRRKGAKTPVTIGVGDGGNEIGMGNVRARLIRQRSPLAPIASIVPVDHLVVAGTSNWGAYGIVAALARLTGRDLVHDPALEPRVIQACVAAGASDGVTRRRVPTVDGLAADVHAAVVELFRIAGR